MKSLGYFVSLFTIVTGASTAGAVTLPTRSDAASVKIEVGFYKLEKSRLTGGVVCHDSLTIPIHDVRAQKVQNADATKALSNCKITENGNSASITALVGSGILTSPGRNELLEDQKSFLLSLKVADQRPFNNWFTLFDLSKKDKNITWEIPAPESFQTAEASRWIRVSVTVSEEVQK